MPYFLHPPGARVILACRDLTKAEAATAEICKETGSNDVVVHELDLASLTSVRQFAEKIKSEESRLDVLINNAGGLVLRKITFTGNIMCNPHDNMTFHNILLRVEILKLKLFSFHMVNCCLKR